MAKSKAKVLVVDDEAHVLNTIGICLDSIGFETHQFSTAQEALDKLRSENYDLAFIDLKMTPIDGMEMLSQIKQHSPETTVIIITAYGSIDSAIEAIKKGAYHYLQKPFDFKELQLFTEMAWDYHKLNCEVRELRRQLTKEQETGDIITRNKDMIALMSLAARVAESNISVLIEGESGTGKELIAYYIHDRSPRNEKSFVKINCAALPEELLESELFGHIKGAFTGALKDRQGRFEMADGGTIFLDEIAEIPPSTQVKLLRVIQSKEFERVGENISNKVDVRIIAATNKNLDEALKEGTFREDLFYRLNAIRLKLTPLRERPEDIPPLLQYFIKKFSKEDEEITFSPEAMKALRTYRWSGNVRELENVVERAVLLAQGGIIELSHLPEELRQSVEKPSHVMSLVDMEKQHIVRVLHNSKDFDEAANILGIDKATLWRKRKKYGL